MLVTGANRLTGSEVFEGVFMPGGLQDQFMKILLTELRYQDPMDPMKEKEFFTQMAQFAAASQMESLNSKVNVLAGILLAGRFSQDFLSVAALVGHQFRAEIDGVSYSGTIEAAVVLDGQVAIKCGVHVIPAANLTFVGGTAHETTDVS